MLGRSTRGWELFRLSCNVHFKEVCTVSCSLSTVKLLSCLQCYVMFMFSERLDQRLRVNSEIAKKVVAVCTSFY